MALTMCAAAVVTAAKAETIEEQYDGMGVFVALVLVCCVLLAGACLAGFLIGRVVPRKVVKQVRVKGVLDDVNLQVAYTGKYVRREGCSKMKHARGDKVRLLKFCIECFPEVRPRGI